MSSLDLHELLNKINIEPYFEYKNIRIYLLSMKSIMILISSTLSATEFKELYDIVNELNVEYQKINRYLKQYYTEIDLLFEEEKIQVNFNYISIFNENYKKIIEIKENMIKIVYELIKKKEKQKKINLYLKKDLPQFWFENLITLYMKYGGVLPVNSFTFWKYIKEKWEIIEPKYDREFLIYICEDILGGLDLDNISINFDIWIRRNIFDTQILKDFYIL